MLARMGLVAAVAAAMAAGPALADQGGVPHNGGGQGSDHAAQPATPAQPGDPGGGATPATPAQPAREADGRHGHANSNRHGKGKGRGHGNSRGESADAGRRSHTTQQATTPPSSHAKAGKTTICHATGSATNPYVEITISNNAVPAHQRHQDGRDIVPAPAGGCPGASESQPSTATTAASGPQDQRLTVTAPSTAPSTTVLGRATTRGRVTPQSHVLGEHVSGRSRAATRSATRTRNSRAAVRTLPAEASSSSRSSLPFTGWDLGIVAAVGAAMLLAGTALRRARRISRVRS